jgi:HK97 family phage portal protein
MNKFQQYIQKSLNSFLGNQNEVVRDSDGFMPITTNFGYDFDVQEFRAFIIKSYGSNPYVFNVIDRICEKGISIQRELINANTDNFLNNSQLATILEKPNAYEGLREFLYRYYANYLAWGEVFVVKGRDPLVDGGVSEMYVPNNYNVTVNQDANGQLLSYDVCSYGNTIRYSIEEVLHVKRPNITNETLRGFSILQANRKVWITSNEILESEAFLHKNKGASGILYSDGLPLTPEEQKQNQQAFDKMSTGANFAKTVVVNKKLGYHRLGLGANDLKSVESNLDKLRVTCSAFNAPSVLFGDTSTATYNNMKEAKTSFILDAVLPIVEHLDKELINWLSGILSLQGVEWNIIRESIFELSQPNIELSQKIVNEVNAGIITPEEAKLLLYPNGI